MPTAEGKGLETPLPPALVCEDKACCVLSPGRAHQLPQQQCHMAWPKVLCSFPWCKARVGLPHALAAVAIP